MKVWFLNKLGALKVIKIPGPSRLVMASLCAYWLSGIVNSAFIGIAMLFLLLIPVVLAEFYFWGRSQD